MRECVCLKRPLILSAVKHNIRWCSVIKSMNFSVQFASSIFIFFGVCFQVQLRIELCNNKMQHQWESAMRIMYMQVYVQWEKQSSTRLPFFSFIYCCYVCMQKRKKLSKQTRDKFMWCKKIKRYVHSSRTSLFIYLAFFFLCSPFEWTRTHLDYHNYLLCIMQTKFNEKVLTFLWWDSTSSNNIALYSFTCWRQKRRRVFLQNKHWFSSANFLNHQFRCKITTWNTSTNRTTV